MQRLCESGGCKVIIHGRNEVELDKPAAELNAYNPGSASTLVADFADLDAVKKAADSVHLP